MKTLGFLGKEDVNDEEIALLHQFGRVVAAAGRELVIVPTPGSVAAVEVGVNTEGGRVRHITGGVLSASAHSFVYADERLLTRIVQSYPSFREMRNVFLFSSPLEIEKFLRTSRKLLDQWGIPYPE